MPPSNIHWKGLPRYHLPRIRSASGTIIHDSSLIAFRDVFKARLPEAFERTREETQMRARKHRLARSQATFPNLAIYRRSIASDHRAVAQKRQIIFPHRRAESRRASSSSHRDRRTSSSSHWNRQTSGRSKQSRESRHRRQSRHVRRLVAQQKLVHSRASLRRNISTNTRRSQSSHSPPRRSTSTRSSGFLREPSTRSQPTKRASLLPQIHIHKSRSLRSRTPGPRFGSPAPYWGTIPSPLPAVRKTPLDKQTFVSRRVGGRYVHEPIPLKQSSNDILHRGLSNSSRKSRVYDKRLPAKKSQAEIQHGFIILPDAQPQLPLLFPSSLDFAKLDGSSAGLSSSRSSSERRQYPDEESGSEVVNAASRTTSEARVLDDFTQGLQQHLRIAEANPNPRPRSPSVAQTIVSTHTLQELVAFREEFKAAGLAVTSKDQKGERSKRPSTRKSSPPKIFAQHSRGAGFAASARRPSVIGTYPPKANNFSALGASTLAVPAGVEVKSPRSVSPLAQGGHPALIAVRTSIDQGRTPMERSKIPIPKEKPLARPASPKKPLPWLKKNELPLGQDSQPAFRPQYPADSPSRATNNSSVTTIIDFSPHPSEFWNRQGLDFNDFRNRHPGLMDRNKPPELDDGIIMLENEIKQPEPRPEPQPEPQPEPKPDVKTTPKSNGQVIIHDKSGPPKPLRIEVSEGPYRAHHGGGHRAPSPLQTQLFPEDIDTDVSDLVRADSLDDFKPDKTVLQHDLPTVPDFSSFVSGSSSDPSRRRRSVHRPKSAGDERGLDPPLAPIYGRRASKEEIWAEKRRRSREELVRKTRAQGQYDEQRNEMPRTKFDIKKVTPWELGSESTDTGDVRKKSKVPDTKNDEHIQIEIIGTRAQPSHEKQEMDGSNAERKARFGPGKLKDMRSRLRALFGSDQESHSSTEDEPSQPSASTSAVGPKIPETVEPTKRRQEKEKMRIQERPTIVVPECEECQNPHSGVLSLGRPTSLNEPKSARSFQEWQAGVPFKPLSREPSINQHGQDEVFPCGHPKVKLSPYAGDPVKRNVAARRTNGGRSLGGSRAPSIFTIQESVPKTAPRIMPPAAPSGTATKKPVLVGSDSSSDISDREVLKGLGIVMEGVVNEDVQAWIKEATGTNVRRFLGDLAALDKLGTGQLADKARRTMSKRQKAMEKLGSVRGHKKGRSEGSVL